MILDHGPLESIVCPCGTTLLAAEVVHVTDDGVTTYGHLGVEVISGELHECPEWAGR